MRIVKLEKYEKKLDGRLVEKRDDAVSLYSIITNVDTSDKKLNDGIRDIVKIKRKITKAIEEDAIKISLSESERSTLLKVYGIVRSNENVTIPINIAEAMLEVEDAESVENEN